MFEKKYANLHFHSTHSDGEDTIERLIEIALEEGYGGLALADHNTVTGWGEMEEACKKAGLEFIRATEFSVGTKTFDTDFHMVGFDFDENEPKMRAYLEEMAEYKISGTKAGFDYCVENGIIEGISWSEVEEATHGLMYMCHDHIFRVMRDKGLLKDSDYVPFCEKWVTIPKRKPFEYREPKEIIELIKNAGGVTILAHPNEKFPFVDELVKMGLGGIETWHPDLTDEQAVYAEELAKKYNLYISGGTDHCGLMGGQYKFYEGKDENPFYTPSLKYGSTKENFDKLKNRVLG